MPSITGTLSQMQLPTQLASVGQQTLLAVLSGVIFSSVTALVVLLVRRNSDRVKFRRLLDEMRAEHVEQQKTIDSIRAENANLNDRLERLDPAEVAEARQLFQNELSREQERLQATISDEQERLQSMLKEANAIRGKLIEDERELLERRRQVAGYEVEASRSLEKAINQQFGSRDSMFHVDSQITEFAQSVQASSSSMAVGLAELQRQLQTLNDNQRQIAMLIAQASRNQQTDNLQSSAGPQTTPRSLANLRFTAYYTDAVSVATWAGLRVYTHLEAVFDAVRRDAAASQAFLGDRPSERGASARHEIRRGDLITIVPSCEGVEFRPKSVMFDWTDDWQSSDFQYRASAESAGTTKSGKVRIFVDGLITAQIEFALSVQQQQVASASQPSAQTPKEATSRRFQRVFGSYSHKDSRIVLAYRDFCKAKNDEFYLDIDSLRPGRKIDPELLKLMDQADVVQLFWSAHSAKSKNVRTEWEHALSLNRGDDFLLPVYWKRPFVTPPPQLREEWFVFVPMPKLSWRRWMFFKLFGYVG